MRKKLMVMGIAATVVFFSSFGIGYAGSPCADILVDGDSIQDAIDAANPGDKICVEPGTYTEDLFIDKSIELAGRDFPTIEGVAVGGAFPQAFPNIDIRADDVSIHGFIIQSPVVDASHYSSGMVLTGEDIAIYNNNFLVGTGTISQGIQTWNTVANSEVTPGTIAGLKICNNQFSALMPATGDDAYEGIYINPQNDDVELTTVVIENNRFSGGIARAITTERSNTIIKNNRMTTDSDTLYVVFPRGIQLQAGENHEVLGNKVENSGASVFEVGILVRSTDSSIVGNDVDTAAQKGIVVEGTNNTMKKNRVSNSEIVDLFDDHFDCDDNVWTHNIFGTAYPEDCID